MILAILSVLTAFIIAIGRPSAVFLKIKPSLWFFSNFEKKRIYFSITSILFGVAAILFNRNLDSSIFLLVLSLLFLMTTFIFDFKYVFPEVKSVQKVAGTNLKIPGNKKIIGVNRGAYSVAYPLDVLMARHIINDAFEGNNFLVSYCALCRSGLVFSSELDGRQLYFKVAGVWRRNMIMVDEQTQSIWQQATGECIYGTLKGKRLELLSGEQTTWQSWLEKHRTSMYANTLEEARRGYLSVEKMLKGLELTTTRILPPGFTDITQLPAREIVFGVDFNGVSKAYPKSRLKDGINYYDSFGDETVKFRFDKDSDYLSATVDGTDTALIVEKHWWLGWKEFHPQTTIWEKQ
jgi:hypothetical protein